MAPSVMLKPIDPARKDLSYAMLSIEPRRHPDGWLDHDPPSVAEGRKQCCARRSGECHDARREHLRESEERRTSERAASLPRRLAPESRSATAAAPLATPLRRRLDRKILRPSMTATMHKV